MIRLSAVNVSRCYFLNKKKLRDTVKFVLNYVGISTANLSIVFVTDSEIKHLNYLYRKRNKPTDVLSFSMQEGRRLKGDSSILGDVVISVDRARKQARKFGSTFKREIFLYIIHGVLHLLGYDDEKPSSRRRMQRKEAEILEVLTEK